MMAINGGRDENKFEQVGPEMPVMEGDVLDYEEVLRRMDIYRPWLAKTYVSAMNTIHYMHDKYAYEKSQMALHDTEVPPPDGVRHRRHELHGGLALRHQVREGKAHPQPGERHYRRFRDRGRLPEVRQRR